jgi:hypothetical protein
MALLPSLLSFFFSPIGVPPAFRVEARTSREVVFETDRLGAPLGVLGVSGVLGVFGVLGVLGDLGVSGVLGGACAGGVVAFVAFCTDRRIMEGQIL